MKLTDLKLRNFTVFESADFAFAPGINVIIGVNATGKSYLLKVIYALLDAARGSPAPDPAEALKQRLASVFLPDGKDVGRLVRSGADGPCTLAIKSAQGETHASLSEHGHVGVTLHNWKPIPQDLQLDFGAAGCDPIVDKHPAYREGIGKIDTSDLLEESSTRMTVGPRTAWLAATQPSSTLFNRSKTLHSTHSEEIDA